MCDAWHVLAYLSHHRAQHKLRMNPPPSILTSHRYRCHFNSEMWCIYGFLTYFNLPDDGLQIRGNMSHITHKTLSNTVVSDNLFCLSQRNETGCLALRREWTRGHNNKRVCQVLVLSQPAPWEGQNSIRTTIWFLLPVMVKLWFWVILAELWNQHIHCVTLCPSQLYQTVSNTVTAISGNNWFK